MSLKYSFNKLVYFISALIVVTNQFGQIIVNQYFRFAIAAFWTFYLLVIMLRGSNSTRVKNIYFHLRKALIPFAVFAVYSIMAWIIKGNGEIGNYTRLASTILYLALSYGFAGAGVLLFGANSINTLFYAGCLSYLLGSIIPVCLRFGFTDIVEFLLSTLNGVNTNVTSYMEVHDLTFAFGLFLIYFLFIEPSEERKHTRKIVIGIILIFLGLKRIELLALAATFIAYVLILKKAKTMRQRSSFFAVAFLVASLLFVWIIYDGTLLRLATLYGIDFKHRLGYYEYAKEYYNFSPFFTGQGYTYFSKMWQGLYFSRFRIEGYAIAASLHSDILVMFIEVGFWGMIFWIFYYFKYLTMKFHRRYGILVSECYLLLTIYMFLVYFTDNTTTYTITQLVYFLIPLATSEVSLSNFRKRYLPYDGEG